MAPLYLALSIPALNFLGALSSLLAAFYWFRASQVKAPPKALLGVAPLADSEFRTNAVVDCGNGSNAFVDATPLVEYAQESGRRNKTAALWSAAAALFMGLTWFLPWTIGLLAHA
jgi:hypothetical protein